MYQKINICCVILYYAESFHLTFNVRLLDRYLFNISWLSDCISSFSCRFRRYSQFVFRNQTRSDTPDSNDRLVIELRLKPDNDQLIWIRCVGSRETSRTGRAGGRLRGLKKTEPKHLKHVFVSFKACVWLWMLVTSRGFSVSHCECDAWWRSQTCMCVSVCV